MQPIIVFEDSGVNNLTPLVYWRTVFELRCGRRTLLDRVAHFLKVPVAGLWTRDVWAAVATERLQVPANARLQPDTLLINGRWLFDRQVDFHAPPYVGTHGDHIAYIACDAPLADRLTPADLLDPKRSADLIRSVAHGPVDARMIDYAWDLVSYNAEALQADWTGDRAFEGKVSSSAHLLEPDLIHVGDRAVVGPTAVIDAQEGPVYIAEGARIGPHTYIAGPTYIGPGAVIKPHTHIHGGTTIGPLCKVGGEVYACIIAGYSNKQHAGFLGQAYVASWVNLGAGTVNSNLKNTYGSIRVPVNGRDVDTGLTFFGSIIGDHAKLGIQQALPTGASIGCAAMVASSRILPKFVPSFSWLADDGSEEGDPERLLATARLVMRRREVICSDAEAQLFITAARIAREWETAAPA
ncbi:MAG TPA: putative sugar nucleotidyl transferase [Phycisphaerae bacterium]|nr:putative sugar nucleotidyl transferase [Phycisphaerae bacterium]